MSNPTGWFYRQEGKTVGPVSETDLDALVQNGTLTPETFIWQKGLPQWQRYRELRGAPAEPAPAAESQSSPAESGGAWYYVLNGQTVGPVSEADLDALVQNGSLPPDTYVFCQGMSDWQAYSTVKAVVSAAPPPVLPVLKIGAPAEPAKPAGLRISAPKIVASAPPVVQPAAMPAAGRPLPLPRKQASSGDSSGTGLALACLAVFGVMLFFGLKGGTGAVVFHGATGIFSLIVGIMILVAAFSDSVGQGFLTLCVPCYVLYFVFARCESNTLKMLFAVSILVRLAGLLVPLPEGWKS